MSSTVLSRLPPIFISHGAPSLYLSTSAESFAFYRNLGKSYLERTPKVEAVVVFSAHWETDDSVHVTTAEKHEQVIFLFLFLLVLLFNFSNFINIFF